MRFILILILFSVSGVKAYQSFEALDAQIETLTLPSEKLSFLLEQQENVKLFSMPDTGNFYYRLGFWQIENGLYDDALLSLNKAIEIKGKQSIDSSYIDALLERSYVLYINSNDISLYCPDRKLALDLARTLNQADILAKSLSQYSFCFQDQENFIEAIALLDEALSVTIDASLPPAGLSVIHNATGLVYQKNFMFDKAYEHVFKAWEIWDREGDVYDAFNMLHNLVDYASTLEKFDLAREHVNQMYDMSKANSEYQDFVFFAAFNDGLLNFRLGNYSEAVNAFEKAIANEEKTNEVYFVAHARLLLSEALLQIQQFERAREVIASIDQQILKQDINKIRIAALNDFINGEYRNISRHLLDLDKIWQNKLASFIEQQKVLKLRNYEAEIKSYENQLLAQKLAISELELAQETAKNRITMLSVLLVSVLVFSLLIVVYQLAKAKNLFKSRSETDFLTGIANRSYMMEYGKRVLEKSILDSKPFSVILFDLDDFKFINDTHGHDAGDTVLKMVAKITRQQLREADLFGRIGGEEFLILVPSLDSERALEIAHRIRTEIAKTDVVMASASIKCSVSIGVASHSENMTLAQLISIADKALYKAKRAGKNTVISASKLVNT